MHISEEGRNVVLVCNNPTLVEISGATGNEIRTRGS